MTRFLTLSALALLFAAQAAQAAGPCDCRSGVVVATPAATQTAAAPAGGYRSYSYEPGTTTAQVAATPTTAYRSYSYSPSASRSYSSSSRSVNGVVGVHSAGWKLGR